MSTPHNSANKGDIAKLVLMPGDPLRAKKVAETYLSDVVEFNHVRGMLGYTGYYKGKKVSVMGSGMGMPSIGIYSYELFTHYDVEAIIRIGSTGALKEEIKVYDVVMAKKAFSASNYAYAQSGFEGHEIEPNKELCDDLKNAAEGLGYELKEGVVHSSDVFYYQPEVLMERSVEAIEKHDCCVVEMESFALFHNANILGKKAACLLTVSDSLVTHEETTAEERQESFTKMMEIALEVSNKYCD